MNRAWIQTRRLRFDLWVRRTARRVYIRAIIRRLRTGSDHKAAETFLYDGAIQLESDVVQWLDFTKTETDIIAARLARRNDPGMALNEAYQRTQNAVDAGLVEDPDLTGKQKAALKFQEEFLRKNAATAKRPLGT